MAVLWIELDPGVIKQKQISLGSLFFFLTILFVNNCLLNDSIVVLLFRFCPQLSEDIAMDEKDDVKLVRTLWETKVDMVRNSSKVSKLAQLLK